jgi:pimeloyl-ACP methyl ester carboxylesterase
MPVAERLQADYQVILMESRGTGESQHTPKGNNHAQYAADVIGLLDHLAIERVTFAGHSLGGGIGYILALDYPKRLERLVLMAPIPAQGVGEITPELREQRLAERRLGDRAAVLARYRAMQFRADVETDAWFHDRVDHIFNVSDGHFEGSAQAMRDLNVVDRLHEIHTPTLMIAGAVDNLLKPDLLDFMRLPNATLEVLARAGHEVAVHEPDRVAQAIRSFMTYGPITGATLLERLT